MKKFRLLAFTSLILCGLALAGCGATEDAAPQSLRLATTTSTYDSGLLDDILPAFEEQYDADVEIIAVGTGQALALGEAGDADVLLVHAPEREQEFVDAGFGLERVPVMHNDFVILGPADDPADAAGADSAADALARIAAAEQTFVSRGDDSGTHIKELSVWEAAGITPEGDWYQSAGQGMGEVLTLADEQQAYTLSDRGTYLARTMEGITLEILYEGDPVLFNPYGVIAVNPDLHDGINAEGAQDFIAWITSLETQEAIAGFQKYGQPLFTPDSAAWNEAHGG